MPRTLNPTPKSRHDPLHRDIVADDQYAKYGNVSKPGRRKKTRHANEHDEDGSAEVVLSRLVNRPSTTILDPKTSGRIFQLARDQQDELDPPEAEEDEDVIEDDFTRPRTRDLEQLDDDDDDEGEEGQFQGFSGDEEREFEIDEGDIQTLDALHSSNAGERKTLADLIFAKLESGAGQTAVIRASNRSPGEDEAPNPAEGLDPKVVEVYTKVGKLLRSYRAGPLPKPFKIIPSLPAWARILALTAPEQWSPQATHAATRIFISNMKPPQARVYLEGVVLGLVRADLEQPSSRKDTRKLSPHLYEALNRALYKPAAFFKGIVFPLLDGGCTLKEAAIVASVLAKVKVPLLHSSAALIRLAGMDYSGPTSLFIRVLLDKKHALPYKVLDALVFHFIRLGNTHAQEHAAVLWHQSLLVALPALRGAPRAGEQKDALRDVGRAHPHAQIAP
ncbi:Bystin-domain-containing protein [Russula ochroleuca]|uniref:Bystin-domain-containing protein n=1 Tax=Russula ochroleuca TaxID=152965 RepID=A0A9P5N3J5_9AGAM|nr:Bystin-domain-containing protein [Russula ochroleuca]